MNIVRIKEPDGSWMVFNLERVVTVEAAGGGTILKFSNGAEIWTEIPHGEFVTKLWALKRDPVRNLSARVASLLEGAGISLEACRDMTDKEILAIPGIGPVSLLEIRSAS